MVGSLLLRFFGPPKLFLYDDGTFSHGMVRLLDEQAPQDTLIKDSIKRIRDQLTQIPEGKKAALVVAVDYKFGVLPTVRTGLAYRAANGWEIHGEGFISKASKGASIVAVRTW